MTANRIVYAEGSCRICGRPVVLFESDLEEYLANIHRGLIHFTCPDSPRMSDVQDEMPGEDRHPEGQASPRTDTEGGHTFE